MEGSLGFVKPRVRPHRCAGGDAGHSRVHRVRLLGFSRQDAGGRMVLMGLVSFPRWLHRWLWFAALYAAGVGTLAVVAYGLRALLKVLG